MTPYYDEDGITIYHGDCREVLPGLAFDVMVTDPPYGTQSVTVAGDDHFPTDVIDGTVPTVAFGSGRIHVGTIRSLTTPPDRVMVWAPAFALTKQSTGGVLHRWDPIYVWGAVPTERGEPPSGDVFRQFSTGRTSITKPVSLMLNLIALMPPGVVLDPFMGSGSTLVAAKQLGDRAIGVEVDERYCEIAAKRLAQGVLDFGVPA